MSNEPTVKQETQPRDENLQPGRVYRPNVEIRETDEAIWIWADMPGVADRSVDVRLDSDVLRIRGDVEADDYDDLTPIYTEYNIGRFQREFRINAPIDDSNVAARMKNGVLELKLPKAEEARPRQIPITVH